MKTHKKDTRYKLDPELKTFVNRMGKFYESYGLSRIAGQMIGLLIIADKPLSHEDIQKILNVSRGSVSTNMKMILLSTGLDEINIPGDRKTYYKYSDYSGEKALQIRINSFLPFLELVNDCIQIMKKKNLKVRQLEDLKEFVILEKELIENLLSKIKLKNKGRHS